MGEEFSKKWYTDAIVYGLDVKLFQDSNNDGFGDFQGLTSRLDYLQELGINCLWLMPFYPSPLKDYGYDVCDFLTVDPRLGTMDDFLNFVQACKERGIRILTDLVINHTSTEHPWFIQAKCYRDSPYRDYYIWRDEKPKNEHKKVMFEGVEDSIWEYVSQTDSYYLHSYYREQADLNVANHKVKEEIYKIVRFWLDLGISGFRIDAAHTLTETPPNSPYTKKDILAFLEEIRKCCYELDPEAVLLGEVDVSPSSIQGYFGKGNRMQMFFNFYSNQHTMLAMARKEAAPLVKTLNIKARLRYGHALNFVRHHDELNTGQLTKKEQKEVLERFAPMEKMRIFNGGIKRELAPMMDNDIRKIKLTYAIIFSLPGSPMLHYGEEIGMGDDLDRELRAAVRLPMQWSNTTHGGFSAAPLEYLRYPPLKLGEYGYRKVNVEDQKKDKGSLYHFMCQLIRRRKEHPQIGTAEWEQIAVEFPGLLLLKYGKGEYALLIALNLASKKTAFSLQEAGISGTVEDILSESDYKKSGDKIAVNGYGFRWMKLDKHQN
ncbi:alpha-amylase family protein [Negadavirga shengliensis]|uniref:Alpha-amylase n=1 Tax=Negadavirga shengliensis TaxID=1389218 RepID=A0ABV9SVT7_9BACT